MYNCYYAKTHVFVYVKAIRSRKERSILHVTSFGRLEIKIIVPNSRRVT